MIYRPDVQISHKLIDFLECLIKEENAQQQTVLPGQLLLELSPKERLYAALKQAMDRRLAVPTKTSAKASKAADP